ncbi:hypothetical protein M422DRAFT_261970 [Sphaerobolus stellatus SS14]|uniref:FAD/NAD(P)-binding domain-containing protein n=1 Tax=Sphaerobolus stellatus (strain SS14) TaxID=990650 RepID=A0A0C9VDX1_SPHS4|nr:hypothetical protein M422DRAFT_261970 [Sphaerobolus stellatus SS14]
MASLPTTTAEERDRLLSFVVCGGGPGIEVAAVRYYRDLRPPQVQSESDIDIVLRKISKYAEEKFRRDGVDLITDARVASVTPTQVLYTLKDPITGNRIEKEIPTNFVLWSTGISMNPFTKRVSDLLPNQVHQKAIVVDPHLRVVGAPTGSVYAVGDCATVSFSFVL